MIRIRRVNYFEHLFRMNEDILNKKTFNFFSKKKNTIDQMTKTIKDIVQIGILNRNKFRGDVRGFQVSRESVKPRTAREYSGW